MRRLFFALLLVCGGCASHTVAPVPVQTHVASFDGNAQNSGIISADSGGFLVTPHFLARYDALLKTYGARLSVPRKAGDREGIISEKENYRFDAEAFSRFDVMNQQRKADSH